MDCIPSVLLTRRRPLPLPVCAQFCFCRGTERPWRQILAWRSHRFNTVGRASYNPAATCRTRSAHTSPFPTARRTLRSRSQPATARRHRPAPAASRCRPPSPRWRRLLSSHPRQRRRSRPRLAPRRRIRTGPARRRTARPTMPCTLPCPTGWSRTTGSTCPRCSRQPRCLVAGPHRGPLAGRRAVKQSCRSAPRPPRPAQPLGFG